MIASAIRDICENRFSDTANTIRTEAEWLEHINAAYRLFVQATRWPSLTASSSVTVLASTRSIAVSAPALQGGIVGVFVTATGKPLEAVPSDLPWRTRQFMLDQPSTPMWFEMQGDRLMVLPAPAANTALTVLYMGAPTALAAGETPAIPETYHDALVAGALARAYRDDDAGELAALYDGEFERYVAAAKGDRPA